MKYVLLLLILIVCANSLFAQSTMTPGEFLKAKQRLLKEKDDLTKADLLYKSALYHLEKEGLLKEDIDSAAQLNKQLAVIGMTLGNKKSIAQSMLVEGKITKAKGQDSIANRLKQKALKYAIKNKLIKEQADINYSLAEDIVYQQEKKSYELFGRAASLYHAAGAFYNESETLLALAIVDIYYDRLQSALKYIHQAIEIKRKMKLNNFYKEYAILANIYGYRGSYRDALEYALKAERIAEHEDVSDTWRQTIYNYLGSLYIYLNQLDEAMYYHKKQLALAKKIGERNIIVGTVVNMSNILYRQGKFTEALAFLDSELHYIPGNECDLVLSSAYLQIYCKLGKYGKAKPYYENLLKFKGSEHTNSRDLELMYHAMTQYLIETGHAQKSYIYISRLQDLANNNQNTLDLAKLEQASYKADSATGNYQGAFEHLKRFKILKDSIFNTATTIQLQDLKLKYETEKKDRDIKLLNSKNQLQRIRADNAEKAKNITLGGIVLSLIIISLLFVLYLAKQRNNKKLETHQKELDQKNLFLETLTEEQEKLLKEKEWLVKEVHHRVKNNLQMVTSLLYSQSVYLKDDAAKRAVNDSLHRMQAMAIIHQKLYQEENNATVSMPEYIAELILYLGESFDTSNRILFRQSIEPIQLDVSQAIPLGLIVTESIVNAIKYAFLNEQSGTVSIALKYDPEDLLLLEISDDGVGLPSDSQLKERNSLGLDLMEGLAKQLSGTFTIKSDNGVYIAVRFKKK